MKTWRVEVTVFVNADNKDLARMEVLGVIGANFQDGEVSQPELAGSWCDIEGHPDWSHNCEQVP